MGSTFASDVFGDRRIWLRELAIATAAGVFLGLIGPFGSYLNSARWIVLAYWVGALWMGTMVFGLILRPALHLAPRWRIPPLLALLVGALLAAVPLAGLCRIIAEALWPVAIRHITPAVWYVQVLVISAPLTLAYAAASGLRLRPGAIEHPSGEVEPELEGRLPARDGSSFFGRLPARVGREVVALQMEDHYVRVHTAEGSALVLVPLHQAIAELSGLVGVKVHRSWWVVGGAVTGSVRDGRNVRLRLSNGLEAPVSRTRLPEAKAAGLVS